MKRVFLSVLCCTAIAAVANPVRAEAPSETTPPPVTASSLPTTSHEATCSDDDGARTRKRDAALVELGKRLSAEPAPTGDYRVLNRTGHNYGARSPEQ
jgi:hypothetical protein